ncbi:hypothetical protein D3C75_1363830 [compost metagenome]
MNNIIVFPDTIEALKSVKAKCCTNMPITASPRAASSAIRRRVPDDFTSLDNEIPPQKNIFIAIL